MVGVNEKAKKKYRNVICVFCEVKLNHIFHLGIQLKDHNEETPLHRAAASGEFNNILRKTPFKLSFSRNRKHRNCESVD